MSDGFGNKWDFTLPTTELFCVVKHVHDLARMAMIADASIFPFFLRRISAAFMLGSASMAAPTGDNGDRSLISNMRPEAIFKQAEVLFCSDDMNFQIFMIFNTLTNCSVFTSPNFI